MNDTLHIIKSRRSIRAYSDRPVDRPLIEQILEAGRFAPSSLNTQPWKFVVITDAATILGISSYIKNILTKVYKFLPVLRLFMKELRDEKLSGAIKKTATGEGDTVFYGALLVILILSDRKGRWVATDCALAAENMMLAAHSLGLGSCFIGRGDMINKNRAILGKLGVGSGYRVHATLVFGYPKEAVTHVPERKIDDILAWK
jgi:nitroreductase